MVTGHIKPKELPKEVADRAKELANGAKEIGKAMLGIESDDQRRRESQLLDDRLKAELERLKAENEKLKADKADPGWRCQCGTMNSYNMARCRNCREIL
jgi:hypothetical protein